VSLDDVEIRVRIAAPPAEGRTNETLIRFLSSQLGVPPSQVSLLRGAAGRHKVVEVVGLSEDEALQRLRPV
jgi:uncharacterized protein (TIGR00251 family)